jgi:hypothetical protein
MGMFSLLVIMGSGCSFDFGSSDELVQKIGALVNERNQMLTQFKADSENTAMNQAMDQLEQGREKQVNQQAIQKVIVEIKKGKEKREKSMQKTKIIRQKAIALKKEINGLSSENQKLAKKVLDDFIHLTSKEADMYASGIKLDQQDLAYYQALSKKKKPAKDKYDQLVKKQQKDQIETDQALSQFNQSWDQFHERVTGLHTKQPTHH